MKISPVEPAASATTQPPALRPRSIRGAALGFCAMVLAPLALAAAYFYWIAADRYVTEFRYSVRSGALLHQNDSGLGGMVGASAGLVFASDSFVLENYLSSIEAMTNVEARLPLREMLGRDGGDPVRRFDPAAAEEDMIAFWRAAVRPRFDAITGVTTVEVRLFTPEDSRAVAEALVVDLRRIIDSLSADARDQMLAYVEAEYARVSSDLNRAREAIEAFRRANLIISPTEEVTIGADIIGALSSRLAERRVEQRTLMSQTPNSPRIPTVERQIRSLEEQLEFEVARRGGENDTDALPRQLSSFDELQNTYQIARDTYVATLQLKQAAEAAATLRSAELVVFVPPRSARVATLPDRPLELLKVFGVALAFWLIGRILLASFRTQ